MSGPKAPNLCPTCRHLSTNGKLCYAADTHPFKKGICRAYEPKSDSRPEQSPPWSTSGQEEAEA